MSKIGLYIHIPFCKTKCPYCDFYSVKQDLSLMEKYTDALLKQIQHYKGKNILANSLYFGGGTPILLPPHLFKKIINAIKSTFNLSGEISLEANPCSTDYETLKKLYDIGINRISFGMQSAVDKELYSLGRKHTNIQVNQIITDAKKAGFKNISIDLMIGTPYQTMDSLLTSLNFVKQLDIQHISVYMLKIEKNTPFYNNSILKHCCDEDEICDMYLKTIDFLEQNDFKQYEISNFSKKHFECKHNLKYWKCEEYIGFGSSAHSYFDNNRFYIKNDINKYIDNPLCYIIEDQDINKINEYIMLNLRLKSGIDLDFLKNNLNFNINNVLPLINKFENMNLIKINKNKISLTKNGFLLSNTIISEIIGGL